MKTNRFVAFGVVALLVLSGLGFVSVRALGHGSTPQGRPAQATQALDTDSIEEQVGDQTESDTAVDVEQGEESTTDQESVSPETDSETDQAALQAQAKITTEAAQQTALEANPGATVLKSELDDENGTLVYSLQLSNGLEVKVDASTGQILKSEPAD
jgi:uncharacterized membrane protein YkoI